MKTGKMVFVLAMVFMLGIGVIGNAPADANLIENGTFEDDLNNWVATSWELESYGVHVSEEEAEFRTEETASVSQTVAVTASGSYTLTFSFAGILAGSEDTLSVYWGENLLNAYLISSGWQTQSITFTANEGETELRFSVDGSWVDYLFEGQWDYGRTNMHLDNVSLVAATESAAVPEPATLLLLGMGMIGLGGLRLRNKA